MTRNRRKKGTGSLYQRKSDGYWIGAHWAVDATGAKHRETVGDWDEDVAAAKLDALVAGEKLPANMGELREVKAVAWGEGWDAREDQDGNFATIRNPYKDS